MIKLKSVSKPQSNNLETAATVNVPERQVLEGAVGNLPTTNSRAQDDLVVVGKGEPIQRQFASSAISALESVIGVDDRTRILETELAPWRMVCALRMSSSGGSAIGTGWLAGPRTVITAGHCVHHAGFFGGWADSIDLSAGRNGSKLPFNTINSTRFSALDRWVDMADPDFDIGCIHLDESLGDDVGWFAVASLTPKELQGHTVNISGYPADRGAGREQYFHANRVLNVGERRVFYDVDTFGGQSGAPVWIYEEDGAPPLVVGIHAYGTGGTPFDLGITANSAPRIIPEVFDQIAAWVEEDNAN